MQAWLGARVINSRHLVHVCYVWSLTLLCSGFGKSTILAATAIFVLLLSFPVHAKLSIPSHRRSGPGVDQESHRRSSTGAAQERPRSGPGVAQEEWTRSGPGVGRRAGRRVGGWVGRRAGGRAGKRQGIRN